MNYKNGRPAKVGDTVILNEDGATPVFAIVKELVDKKNKPNLRIVPIGEVREASSLNCVHFDDATNPPEHVEKKAK